MAHALADIQRLRLRPFLGQPAAFQQADVEAAVLQFQGERNARSATAHDADIGLNQGIVIETPEISYQTRLSKSHEGK